MDQWIDGSMDRCRVMYSDVLKIESHVNVIYCKLKSLESVRPICRCFGLHVHCATQVRTGPVCQKMNPLN